MLKQNSAVNAQVSQSADFTDRLRQLDEAEVDCQILSAMATRLSVTPIDAMPDSWRQLHVAVSVEGGGGSPLQAGSQMASLPGRYLATTAGGISWHEWVAKSQTLSWVSPQSFVSVQAMPSGTRVSKSA